MTAAEQRQEVSKRAAPSVHPLVRISRWSWGVGPHATQTTMTCIIVKFKGRRWLVGDGTS